MCRIAPGCGRRQKKVLTLLGRSPCGPCPIYPYQRACIFRAAVCWNGTSRSRKLGRQAGRIPMFCRNGDSPDMFKQALSKSHKDLQQSIFSFFYLTFSGYTSIEANHYLRLSATLHHASSYIRKMHYLDSPVLLPLSSCSICCSKLHQSISSIPKNPHELLRE
jgi:hypothetical protein